jgi:hypothetical protein
MSKTFCLSSFLPVLFLVVVAVQATRTGRIRITEGDPRDLTLYKGPSNEYTPGRSPLPSYILRAKPTEEQGDRGDVKWSISSDSDSLIMLLALTVRNWSVSYVGINVNGIVQRANF